MDDDNKIEMPIPRTVGEMVEFLQKYPKDYELNIYYADVVDSGSEWENSAFKMGVQNFKHSRALVVTFK